MKPRIAIQGISASFHDIAARKLFGSEIEIVECKSFKDTCEALKHGKSDVVIMAIENSLTGSLLQNYTLLSNYKFKIIGEVLIRIQMDLLVYPGVKFNQIEFIRSHPVALQQCRDFIDNLSSSVKVIESSDTASAAQLILKNKLFNNAAIAGPLVAETYGLDIIRESIEDNKKNFTRFIAISKEGNYSVDNNKASLSFELGHYVGALVDVLQIFKNHNINLSKIQSLPVVGKPYEYCFHVDIDWIDYADYESAIHKVLKHVAFLNVLGEYKKAEPIEFSAINDSSINRDFHKLETVEINNSDNSFASKTFSMPIKFISSFLKNKNFI